MDHAHRRLPFLLAFLTAVFAMPLDIYQINWRGLGTETLSPWQRSTSTVRARVSTFIARVKVFLTQCLRSPRAIPIAAAVVLLAVVVMHGAYAQLLAGLAGAPVIFGLTEVEEVREKANKLGTDMTAITAKAREEKRELTDDEEKRWDDMDRDREKALASERRLLRDAELNGSAGRQTEHRQVGEPRRQPAAGGNGTQTTTLEQKDHAEAMRGFFLTGSQHRTPAMLQSMQKFGMDQESRSMFVTLAAKAPKSTSNEDMREWEQRYIGTEVVSPDNGGHYLLQPSEMLRALEVAMLDFGGMRDVATIVRTDSGVNLPFPTMNDTSNEGAEIAEGIEETTETLPTMAQLILEAFTYSSRKIPVSLEFMQDNAINFQGRVGEILGTRIARITNRRFTVGDGSNKPKGVVTAATSSGITTAVATAVTYDELMGLEHSVDPAYRKQRTGPTAAKFMFHDDMLLALKKIKVPQYSGDTAGYPLWRQGFTVGEPDTIDGYQYVINQHMPLPTASQKSIIFGALYKYQIRDVRQVEIVRLNELRAEFRQVVWLAWSRHDGDLLDAGTHPVKYLTQHA